jgi:hypothetical protein
MMQKVLLCYGFDVLLSLFGCAGSAGSADRQRRGAQTSSRRFQEFQLVFEDQAINIRIGMAVGPTQRYTIIWFL